MKAGELLFQVRLNVSQDMKKADKGGHEVAFLLKVYYVLQLIFKNPLLQPVVHDYYFIIKYD